MSKPIKITLISLLIFIFVCAAGVLYLFLAPNFSNKEEGKQYLLINEGSTYDEVLMRLQAKTKILNKFTFNRVAKILKYSDNIKPGRYLIPNGANNYTFLKRLRSGNQTPVQLKFNNIRTKEQLAGVLSRQLMADSLQFFSLLNDSAFLSKYDLNRNTSITVFLPNTYQVFWTTTPTKLFERMYKEYNSFWTPERKEKAAEIPLTQSQVITLASIVDAESNNSAEKSIIAGLYINRLRKNMPLQADPTVVYALGDFSIRRVLTAYTAIDSPYNTYKYTGLPPGPIRIPSLKTIDAVLNYDKNDYIYMCAKETLNGEHNFASTYSQHVLNAKKYQQALNNNGIR